MFLARVGDQAVVVPDFAQIVAVAPENLIADKMADETTIIGPKVIALAIPEISSAPGPQVNTHDTHRTTCGSSNRRRSLEARAVVAESVARPSI